MKVNLNVQQASARSRYELGLFSGWCRSITRKLVKVAIGLRRPQDSRHLVPRVLNEGMQMALIDVEQDGSFRVVDEEAKSDSTRQSSARVAMYAFRLLGKVLFVLAVMGTGAIALYLLYKLVIAILPLVLILFGVQAIKTAGRFK
jgi:hypothetical protein